MSDVQIRWLDPEDSGAMEAFHALGDPDRPAPLPAGAIPVVAVRAGEALARVTIREVEGLQGAPARTGLLGHYEARGVEAGVPLLRHALGELASRSVEQVLGPMDGTTWERYRFALPPDEGETPPPFFTEPTNPWDYPGHFLEAGLEAVSHYVSQLVPDLGALEERVKGVEEAAANKGIQLTPLTVDSFGEVLDEIHALSLEAFSSNPYYSPIGRERFRAMYEPLRAVLDPELVMLARDGSGGLLGFCFTIPDLLDPAGHPTRAVVKTLAVSSSARGMGLGTLLIHASQQRAAARGYRAAIHALMHVANPSLSISRHGGQPLRRYALYGWTP